MPAPRRITFSESTEKQLLSLVRQHNTQSTVPVSLAQLKAVYRRGSGAHGALASRSISRHEYAIERVRAFMRRATTPEISNESYTQDDDLLNVTASALPQEVLTASILPEEEYSSPEHAVFALAEYSGLGYEVIPAIRASWLRAVAAGEPAFARAEDLAVNSYASRDADLLPKQPVKAKKG